MNNRVEEIPGESNLASFFPEGCSFGGRIIQLLSMLIALFLLCAKPLVVSSSQDLTKKKKKKLKYSVQNKIQVQCNIGLVVWEQVLLDLKC